MRGRAEAVTMPEPTLKLGLVGAGRWGRNYVRTIATLDGLRLAAVASRNPETATLVPPHCHIVTDWHDLIAMPGIDGIIIASPPATHAEILLAAIAAGKHVAVLGDLQGPKIRTGALKGGQSVQLTAGPHMLHLERPRNLLSAIEQHFIWLGIGAGRIGADRCRT